MAKLLFRLRGVPDDEADEVRELLAQHKFDIYETSSGNWGLSMPGIWLQDEGQFKAARDLIDEYQQARTIRVRKKYAQLRREGKNKTFLDWIKANPVQLVLFIAVIVLVLYLQVMLIMDLGVVAEQSK